MAERLFFGDGEDLQADIDQTNVLIDDEGCLTLEGRMTECKAHATASGTTQDLGDMRHELLFTAFTMYSEFPEDAVFLEAADTQCWGFGMFDRQRCDTVHCLCLMSTTLESFAIWIPRYVQYPPSSSRGIEPTCTDTFLQQGLGAQYLCQGTRITEHK